MAEDMPRLDLAAYDHRELVADGLDAGGVTFAGWPHEMTAAIRFVATQLPFWRSPLVDAVPGVR
jgi:hypothetical protein